MSTEVQVSPAEVPSIKASPRIEAGRFTGALRRFSLGAYHDCKAFGLAEGIAHKVASDLASDLGRLMASDPDIAHRVGKANTEGESRLSFSARGRVITTRSMSLSRVMQTLEGLYKEALISQRELPLLSLALREYLEECTAWANQQAWQ